MRTIETNVRGTETILELAAKKKKLVLIASTSEVYGKSTKIPFCEEDDLVMGATVKGRWSYACSKAIDEFLALAYWKERQLPVVVVRLFNTVGPRQTGRYGMVLPNFVAQALGDGPITIFGDGMQSRCFCYVEDVVRAMRQLVSTQSTVGQVFNLGGVEEIRIRDSPNVCGRLLAAARLLSTSPTNRRTRRVSKTCSDEFPRLKKSGSISIIQPR